MMMVIVIKMISKNNVNNHSCHLKGQVSLALQSTVLCKGASVFFKNIYFSTFIPLLTMLNVIDWLKSFLSLIIYSHKDIHVLKWTC